MEAVSLKLLRRLHTIRRHKVLHQHIRLLPRRHRARRLQIVEKLIRHLRKMGLVADAETVGITMCISSADSSMATPG